MDELDTIKRANLNRELNIPLIRLVLFRLEPVTRAWLFGSYARGEQRPGSDIDILIEVSPGLHLTLHDWQLLDKSFKARDQKERMSYFNRFSVDLKRCLFVREITLTALHKALNKEVDVMVVGLPAPDGIETEKILIYERPGLICTPQQVPGYNLNRLNKGQ